MFRRCWGAWARLPSRGAARAVAATACVCFTGAGTLRALAPPPPPPNANSPPPTLPVFSRAEVATHRTPSSMWVTYGEGVYDVTEFLALHPGGPARLTLAAGGDIAPFWAVYAQHKTPETAALLETLRIGTLPPNEVVAPSAAAAATTTTGPYAGDPPRSPLLIPHAVTPFNGETPPALLLDYVTPTDLFFVRNHLPVPDVDPATYALTVVDESGEPGAAPRPPLTISLDDLKSRYPRVEVTALLQCSGNRRSEMTGVRGLPWGTGAAGNAVWGGARLRDVLLSAGVREEALGRGLLAVAFDGADADPFDGSKYGASIPADKAMRVGGDVLLAYEMNGAPLPRDHGAPVRVLVPGVTGARSVKWVTRITAGRNHSTSHWQTADYRMFAPGDCEGSPPSPATPPMFDMPVQGVISQVTPMVGDVLDPGASTVGVRGWAWAGGGRGIARVDVSPDGGASWVTADVVQAPDDPFRSRSWGWLQWEAGLPRAALGGGATATLVARAVDVSGNAQPEAPLHNYRGLGNNAAHHMTVKLQ